ncbi:hypothetical protein K1719_034865 [Acacia pycnantha]|nr:hypothetical protein K1719_034865 [Acacia pycnantha]
MLEDVHIAPLNLKERPKSKWDDEDVDENDVKESWEDEDEPAPFLDKICSLLIVLILPLELQPRSLAERIREKDSTEEAFLGQ